MEDELSTLICLVPFTSMKSSTTKEEAISLIRNSLNLDSYVPALQSRFFSVLPKGDKIQIQNFFEFIDSQEFWKNIRPLVNGYNTITNINLIKSSIFLVSTKKTTQDLIDVYTRMFKMSDSQMTGTLPVESIFHSFTSNNRFLPRKLIKLWIEKNSWAMTSKTEISIQEYLFLASNTFDRTYLMNKYLPRLDLNIGEKLNGIFKIRENLLILDPDEKLDKLFSVYSFINLKFDFENPWPSPVSFKVINKSKKHVAKIDKIIERTMSKRVLQPNPYRKIEFSRDYKNSQSRVSIPRFASKSKKNLVSRASSALKSNYSSIDIGKLVDSQISSIRESAISSYRLPKNLSRVHSYIAKSKLEQLNSISKL